MKLHETHITKGSFIYQKYNCFLLICILFGDGWLLLISMILNILVSVEM